MMFTWGWKLATGTAALVAVLLGFALTQSYLENRYLARQIELADKRINDPKTGFQARLAQSHTNAATLATSLNVQSSAMIKSQSEAEIRLAETEAQLALAHRQNKEQLAKILKLLATPPKGVTILDRYSDIDNRLMESLK